MKKVFNWLRGLLDFIFCPYGFIDYSYHKEELNNEGREAEGVKKG